MTEKKTEITIEDAERAIEAEKQRRLRLCQSAINQALQDHGCELIAVPGISADGRIVATAQIRVM